MLILLSLGIYNTIPFGGDELMYHLSITVEMLHHGGWTMDLGLSHYWHNDIWQWYPKHHYFVMGYLLALAGMSIVGVQIAGILAMLLFALATARLLSLLFEDAGIEYGPWLGLSTVLTLSIPVVFLHFFVRGDTFLHALILIILVLLLRRSYLMAGFLGAFIL
ncbi:MAG TPA: hypothetical protein PK765_03840 [bacterium]|nr:hypothetical protein [bacterium]